LENVLCPESKFSEKYLPVGNPAQFKLSRVKYGDIYIFAPNPVNVFLK